MLIIDNLDLTEYNSYRLRSRCARAYFPNSISDLLQVFGQHKNFKILGNGNNIILSKSWYDSAFIIFNGSFNDVRIDKNVIVAESGSTMPELSESALRHGLSGLEIFFDIPGSVGGAIVMNAGSNGEEIKDKLLRVQYLDLSNMSITEEDSSQLGFGYRTSSFQKNSDRIVLKAWFHLEKKDKDTIKAKMESNKKVRWEKQPREFPNCGSVFKRPEGKFVGPMIDELGLKGFSIGGARISEKHSGFIINKGGATGEDIIVLITEVQKRIRDKFGIDLEVEQKII